jgi:hypothetical protein
MDVQRKTEIAKKIKALLAKTVQAGCTESEAMAATETAQRLLAEYQIDLTEAELIEEGFAFFEMDWVSERQQFIEDRLAVAIGKFTDCKAFRHMGDRTLGPGKKNKKGCYKLVFHGFKSDVAFASWLVNSLITFTSNAAEAHALYECNGYSAQQRREAWKAYAEGVCDRIRARLKILKTPAQVKSVDNRALTIINKSALVEQHLAEQGFCSEKGKKTVSAALNNEASFYAGYARGADAGLNRPINGGSKINLLR